MTETELKECKQLWEIKQKEKENIYNVNVMTMKKKLLHVVEIHILGWINTLRLFSIFCFLLL